MPVMSATEVPCLPFSAHDHTEWAATVLLRQRKRTGYRRRYFLLRSGLEVFLPLNLILFEKKACQSISV